MLELPRRLTQQTRIIILDNIDACCSVNSSLFSRDLNLTCSVIELTQTAALKLCIDTILKEFPQCIIICTVCNMTSVDNGLLVPHRLGIKFSLQGLNIEERMILLKKMLRGLDIDWSENYSSSWASIGLHRISDVEERKNALFKHIAGKTQV